MCENAVESRARTIRESGDGRATASADGEKSPKERRTSG